MARLWNRFINVENLMLKKCLFYWDLNDNAGWGAELKNVFNEFDMDDIFVNRSLCDLDNVSQRILELVTVKWRDDIVSKPKFRTYIKFKDALNPENYAISIINRQRRAITAQLRIGILPIKIETGRFRHMPLEERICGLFRMNVIEDEEHFLCKCPIYDLWHSLYRKAQDVCFDFNTYTSEEKLISLEICVEGCFNIHSKCLE